MIARKLESKEAREVNKKSTQLCVACVFIELLATWMQTPRTPSCLFVTYM